MVTCYARITVQCTYIFLDCKPFNNSELIVNNDDIVSKSRYTEKLDLDDNNLRLFEEKPKP